MEILKLQGVKCGDKCYVKYDGAIRECMFNGTRTTESGVAMMLNVAGIGKMNLLFPRFATFNLWYHGKPAPVGLFRTLDDAKSNKSILGMYGTTDNCYNSNFMQPFFSNVSVCNCGGSNYAWWWDGTDAVSVFVALPSGGYVDDNLGFRFVGEFRVCGYVGNNLRIINREVPVSDLYMTKAACCAEHEPCVVTF